MATCKQCHEYVITYRMVINNKPYWIYKCTKCKKDFELEDVEYYETYKHIQQRMGIIKKGDWKTFYWR